MCVSPSSRAGPARVTIAISFSVYSRASPSASALPGQQLRIHLHELLVAERRGPSGAGSASGYERNDPPLGWSVESTTRHGSALSRKISSPIAHCSAATAALSLYDQRHDAAARLELDVDVGPPAAAALVEQVFDRGVGGDRHRRTEHHLAHVDAQLRMGVHVLDHLGSRPSSIRLPRLATIAVELQMGEMGAPAGQRVHLSPASWRVARRCRDCCSGCGPGAGAGARSPRRSASRESRAASPARPPTESSSPATLRWPVFQASTPPGFTILTAYAPVAPQQPGGVVARAVALARLDLPQQVFVVSHQHEDAAIHARRIVELRMAVPGHEGRDRGVERSGIARAPRSGSRS